VRPPPIDGQSRAVIERCRAYRTPAPSIAGEFRKPGWHCNTIYSFSFFL